MKINIEKSIKSPILFKEGVNAILVYVIAAVLSLIVGFNFSFNFNFSNMPDLSNIFKEFVQNPIFPVVAIVVSIIVLILFLVKILACSILDGYIIETVKNELDDSPYIMPGWGKNYKRFFWNGFRWQLILFCYIFVMFIIPTLILIPLLFLSGIDFTNLDAITKSQGFYLAGIFIVWFIIVLSATVVYFLFFPFIFIRYVEKNRFLAAFNLFAVAGSIIRNFLDYVIAILISFLIMIVSAIVTILLCITCIGILLIPLLGVFVIRIMTLNLFAQAYKKGAMEIIEK